MLKDDAWNWISNHEELEQLVVAYYKRLYSMEDVEQVVEKLPHLGFTRLSTKDQLDLSKTFVAMEVEKTISSMGKYKTLGPDGYQPVFYQHNWEVVGASVVRFVLGFLESGLLPQK